MNLDNMLASDLRKICHDFSIMIGDEYNISKLKKKILEKSFGLGCVFGVEDFLIQLESQKFLDKYKLSQQNLFKHKFKFYSDLFDDIRNEISTIEKKIKMMGTTTPQKDIDEMYPSHKTNKNLLFNIKEIMEKINEKLELSYTNGEYNPQLKKNLESIFKNEKYGLGSIVGREKIKNYFARLLFSFSQNYKIFTNKFNNFCLMGCAGSGKTSLAKAISYSFEKSGIMCYGDCKIVTRNEMISGWVGHTSTKIKSLLTTNLEKVLFVDEAYTLKSQGEKDFSGEALGEFVNFLDKFISMNIIILGGYQQQMEELFLENEGLTRRFPQKFILDTLTDKQLTEILITNLEKTLDIQIFNTNTYNIISEFVSSNQNLFENQGGDCLNISNFICEEFYVQMYLMDLNLGKSAQKKSHTSFFISKVIQNILKIYVNQKLNIKDRQHHDFEISIL